MKKFSAIILSSCLGLAAQSQSIIDPLTGSLSGYTTTLVNDRSTGGGYGVSFASSASGLGISYLGSPNHNAEQALFLAPVSSFSSIFSVGDTLLVNTALLSTTNQMDFGLAISATPNAASSANAWDSRSSFDWASISLRPSQASIRVNTSISGTLNTGGGVVNGLTIPNISELFITWVSADSFTLGYVNNGISTTDETINFNPGSAIGAEIGFYGDLRSPANTLGNFSDLTVVTPAPEPSALALCGMGLVALAGLIRRKK